jgi:putative ABC transport system permease protein
MKLHSYALKELVRHRSRTGATVFGYAIGVVLIVLVLSMVRSQNIAETDVLKTTGTHFMVFITNPTCCKNATNDTGGIFAENVYTTPLQVKILWAIQNMTGVSDAAPYLLYRQYQRNLSATYSIGGVVVGRLSTSTCVNSASDLLRGRYVGRSENNSVVLEESFARSVNIDINETISAFGRTLNVVGIVNSGIRSGKADMYAPLFMVQQIVNHFKKAYLGQVDMNIVLVEATDVRQMGSVEFQIKDLLNKATISKDQAYRSARSAISISDSGAWIITAVIVFVVVVFAFKSQYSSVIERTREIGILKAIGWTNDRIITQIILESLVQAAIGVVIGCVLAILLIYIFVVSDLSFASDIDLAVYYPSVALSFVLALLGGAVAGIFPAWKAGRMDPSESLRRGGGGL